MMLKGGLVGDCAKIERVMSAFAERLNHANSTTLTTPSGTSLTVSVVDRPVIALGAGPVQPGTFCSLPGGELAISLVEGSPEGVLVDPFVLERVELGYR